MNGGSNRAALALAIATAVLLGIGAAADPSGIFAIVGWTGGRPVPALWWWAPYMVYVPLLLAFSFWGARAVLSGEADSSRHWLCLFRLWAVTVLSTSAAEFIYSESVILPLKWQEKFAIPAGETAAFLLWSSGYAAAKMALIGWLPALAGVLVFRARARGGLARTAVVAPMVWLISGGAVLVAALLGPWLAGHWWQGSPVGFIYSLGSPLIAPTPASGAWRSLLAIALMGFVIWRHSAHCLRGMTAGPGAGSLFWTGATAGFAAAAALFAGQMLQLAFAVPQPGRVADLWLVPAALLRAVEAASFALPVAVASGCFALFGARVAIAGAGTRGAWNSGALPRAGWAMSTLAGALVVSSALRFDGTGHTGHTGHAGHDRPLAAPTRLLPGDSASRRLSVEADANAPRIVDALGAAVILRGVNVNQLGEYYRQDPAIADVLPLTEQDFADIAALGMNVVRLTLSWSQLEPERGRISTRYLERIHQAVDWARTHGIYVVLDVHQDAWGAHVAAEPHRLCRPGTAPMVGWDGAPAWATYTDETAPCQVTGRDLAPNVSRAFQSFYVDRENIQTSLIAVWQALAREFADDAAVAGYDLLNEPNFGDTPPIASTVLLANYYARSIQAIRQGEDSRPDGYHHLVFVEPSIIWSGFGLDNLPPREFTTDPQIVFSPHLYNESITADQDFGFNLISIERGIRLAEAAAAQLRAPLWIGEWGYFKGPRERPALLERHLRIEDDAQLGSAFWVWKQACGDPHAYPGKIAGDLRLAACPGNSDLGTDSSITQPLRRPYVRTAPGRIASVSVHQGTVITGESNPGESHSSESNRAAGDRARACDLEIWVPGDAPPKVRSAEGAEVTRIIRVEAGSASLGPSGGWLVSGCLKPGAFRIALD
jgi:Cellulase (glycosyl hydrolase family 5)